MAKEIIGYRTNTSNTRKTIPMGNDINDPNICLKKMDMSDITSDDPGNKMYDPYSDKESEFNMAFAYFKRIHYALFQINNIAPMENFSIWCNLLGVLYREMWPEMKPEEQKDLKELYNNAKKLVRKWEYNNAIGKAENIKLNNNCEDSLELVEVKIRQVIHKRGIMMSKKDREDFLFK